MNEPLVYWNGRRLPQSDARLALNDTGFVFGATVTDLCRTFRHRLYRWDDHLARFRRNCRSAYIDHLMSDAEWTQHAAELVAHNAALIGAKDDLALVLIGTPGPVGFYLGEPTKPGEQPTFGMHTFPLPFARYRPWIEHGVVLRTPSVRAVPAACVDPHLKQRSRMHWWLAEQEVRRVQPDAQALLLDEYNCVTETASANFLLVKDGAIVSPPRENVLDGVSLRVVSELCAALNLRIETRQISLDECHAAEEAMLTCTSYCIAGVRSINERTLRCPGPMLQRLTAAWSAAVGVDISAQIRGDT
jgi:branched-subunit amino acid aminotransferase/4-amino-4-deoxychorismate lyase